MTEPLKFKVYSNDLEDLILYYFFKDEENIFYIDIGAGSPDSGSVTKMMYDLKIAHGINIEPQRKYFKKLCDKRINDINIWAVIGEEDNSWGGGIEFYLNSVNNASRKALYKEAEKDYVPMFTLKNIFDTYVKKEQKVSFLKIDVEGYELEVLRCGFGSCRPQMIIVEYVPGVDTCGYVEYEKILFEHGYSYCMSYLSNRYYVSEEANFIKRKLVPVKQMLDEVPCDFNDEKVKKKVVAEQMINESNCIQNIVENGKIDKVIIWGYGPLGIALHNKITSCGIKDIHIVDKNAELFDTNIKEKIIKPEEVLKVNLYNYTVFLTFQENEEIRKQLQDYNIISVFDI